MRKDRVLILFLILISTYMLAQDTLTLDKAIALAMENNLQIKIARNDLEIAQNNNHPGFAGMLPNASFIAGDTPSNQNIKQVFSNGSEITRDNVSSNTLNGSLALSYTLFDGGRMFATREKLREFQKLGENALKVNIQNTLSDVIQAYSYIVTQEQYIKVLNQLAEVSDSRYTLVKQKMDAGLANNADLYLAQLDKDSRTQAILSQQLLIRNAYTSLNVLINFPLDSVYHVQQSLELNETLQVDTLEPLFRNNPEYLMAGNNSYIALQTEKEMKAARLPRIGITAAYGYSRSQSQAGFSLYNQGYGPTGTISLSVPLFTGMVNQRNYKNAGIQYESAKIREEQTIDIVEASFLQAWELYSTALLQVRADRKSVLVANDYLELIQQRYNLGQSTVIDLREAQRSYEETNFRLLSNQYALKIAETDLLRLTGGFIKQ